MAFGNPIFWLGSVIQYTNPVALGTWLYEQYLRYGVELHLNTQAVSAELSRTDEILSIQVVRDKDKISLLKCDKLVLAAGAWTPAVFKKLFPQSSVNFDPVISAGEWLVFENPEPDVEIAAAYFDDIVGEKLEFAGRSDHTIWVTGIKNKTGIVPDVGEVPEPDQASLSKLKDYSNTFLQHPATGLRVISQGRSYRHENKRRLPIIASLPSSKLSTNGRCDGRSTVYINAGHGSYGVTLGMGSGKLMSQLVLGEIPDINVSKLGIPDDTP
ncbi:MAG: hypothetical protein Q9222_003761 [Ikaeria aurantiellina]